MSIVVWTLETFAETHKSLVFGWKIILWHCFASRCVHRAPRSMPDRTEIGHAKNRRSVSVLAPERNEIMQIFVAVLAPRLAIRKKSINFIKSKIHLIFTASLVQSTTFG